MARAPKRALVNEVTGFSCRADFLQAGEYAVAFVCAGGVFNDTSFDVPAEDPEQYDAPGLVDFPTSIVVADGRTGQVDF